MRLPGSKFDRRLLTTLGTVSGGHFLSHLYILAYPPLFPFLVDDFGLNNTQLGLIMSVVALAMFVFQTPAGELIDRVGAKRVFLLGLLMTGGGTALVSLATTYYQLLFFALLAGIGQAAFHPADYTLLDAVTDDAEEGKSFGVHTFAGYAGFAAAPASIGGLGAIYRWQTALVVVGGFGVLYAAFAHVTMAPVHRRRMAELAQAGDKDEDGFREGWAALARPGIFGLFAFFVVITMASKGIQTFTTVFVDTGLSLTEAIGNTALTVYFSTAAVGVLAGGVLADRYNVRHLIIGSLFVAATGTWLTTVGIASTGPTVVALFGVIGLFYGVALPSRDRLVNQFSTAETTGKSFGLVYSGLPLGGFVAPTLIGGVIDVTGVFSVGFSLIGVFYLLAALVIVAIAVRDTGGFPRRIGRVIRRTER